MTDKTLPRLELMGMNELRAMLYEMGIEYPEHATREQLIQLIKKNS